MAVVISNKKILITGGAGFIGWSLAKKLSTNDIVIIDDLSNSSKNFDPNLFEFYQCSVQNIKSVLGNRNFDYVFHFGEYSRVEQSLTKFNYVFDQNTKQLPALLQYCTGASAKLIYSGSSSIFAQVSEPMHLSPYTLFKKLNCDMIKAYSKWYGLDYAICYFSNVYGPGECNDPQYGTVIQKYMDLVLAGHEELPVTGDGNQTREFTHIDDTISALLLIAIYGIGDGYSISSGKKITINELVSMFDARPVYQSDTPTNRKNTKIDTTKIVELGWLPKHNLKDYIQEIIIR